MILDFGCGEGRRSDGDIDEAIGIDINRDRLKVAKKHSLVVQCDGRLLPFRDFVFSSIVSFSVLEHIKDHEKALSEITRVLKIGGLCKLSMPVDNDPIFFIARRIAKNWQGDAVLSHFTTSQIIGQIGKRMHIIDVVHNSNAPIAGVFGFFGRRTPRLLQKIDLAYDLASRSTGLFHWQLDVSAVKEQS